MATNLNLVLAFAAGITGGVVSMVFNPAHVQAQVAAPPAVPQPVQPAPDEIRGRRFVFTDSRGLPLATLGTEISVVRQELQVVLRDAQGREIWKAGSGTQFRPLGGER